MAGHTVRELFSEGLMLLYGAHQQAASQVAANRRTSTSPKLLQMLRAIEPDVQSFRPEFRAEQFVGGSIGDIYPDSQAAIDRMRALTGSKRVRAPFFGRSL